MGRVAETQINIFKGRWKYPELPNWLSQEVGPSLFPAISPPQVPFISSRNPPFAVLFQGLFIIEIENGGTGVACVQLGIWQQPIIVHLLLFRCSSLLFCTSLAPLCVWGSVCVRAQLIDELVSRSMLLLPSADKWRLASPPHLGISFCLWQVSLQGIDVETWRPESLVPFNPTFQFAFGVGRQYWETADSSSNWLPSNLPESLEALRIKTSLKPSERKLAVWKTSLVSDVSVTSSWACRSWTLASLPMWQSVNMSQQTSVNRWQRWWGTVNG